jgi:O-acetyl-ADP-ribose deacetylase (regulator of RNase III)
MDIQTEVDRGVRGKALCQKFNRYFISTNEPIETSILDACDATPTERFQDAVSIPTGSSGRPEPSPVVIKADITKLIVDVIVNAGNEKGLGCFTPGHRCVDNVIFEAAGPRLRHECRELMSTRRVLDHTPMVTRAYNLPSKYIYHVAGPIVGHKLTQDHIDRLRACYINCIKLAKLNKCKSIAFPCISTGVFSFPPEEAAKIALESVESGITVVFCTYLEKDYQLYLSLI